MDLRYATEFLTYTVAATDAHADYPVTNLLADSANPILEQYRSLNATGAKTVTLDFGAAKTIVLTAVLGTNFTAMTLAGTAKTLTKNALTSHYGNALLQTVSASNTMAIVISAATPVDNAAYFKIGQILCVETGKLNVLSRGMLAGATIKVVDPILEAGTDVQDLIPGDAYRTLQFSDEVEYAAGTGDFDALRAISPATKIMLVDLDSPSQLPVFYGRRMSAEESISLGSTMQSGSMEFIELI